MAHILGHHILGDTYCGGTYSWTSNRWEKLHLKTKVETPGCSSDWEEGGMSLRAVVTSRRLRVYGRTYLYFNMQL